MNRRVLTFLAIACLCPASVFAQASIAGIVKDSSGGVLPGVTVEAASPALIEKVRSATTDGTGQYRIVDLRPGTYTVTFTLGGFTTVRREGIVLSGSFVANVEAEMRVGSVEETLTVTAEAPLVDVQNAKQQRVMAHDVADAIPTGRIHSDLAVLIPGINVTGGLAFTPGNQDVGGAGGDNQVTMAIHGGRGTDQRLTQDGLSIGQASGATAAFTPNPNAAQEVAIDTAGVSAEATEGGVRINFIPREGGNLYSGSLYTSFNNHAMQGNNLSDSLIKRGLLVANSIKEDFDFNPGFGGPIKKDKLWFYVTGRYNVVNNYSGGVFQNATANDPLSLKYVPDTSKPAHTDGTWKDVQGRVTWQATPKQKFSGSFEQQGKCVCPSFISAIRSPEASSDNHWPIQRVMSASWSSPATSHLLLEAGFLHQYLVNSFIDGTQYGLGLNRASIPTTEQSTGMLFKMRPSFTQFEAGGGRYRAAVSYVTGSHEMKAGFNNGWFSNNTANYVIQPIAYRVNNGIPNQITLNALPYVNHPTSDGINQSHWLLDDELGVFVQDKWTHSRVTVSGGLRFDYFKSHFPVQQFGPVPLAPNRNITFQEAPSLNLRDITPRMSVAYDVFGTGKTAVKVTANKYLAGLGSSTLGDPGATLVTSTSRAWTDNGDLIPQCDLINPAQNGECGAMQNPDFGKAVPSAATFDPATRNGWGNRSYNWEFSVGAQHQLLSRMSVDVGFFRRVYGNFTVVDNLALNASDYDTFSIAAPSDPRLPGGGTYTIGGLRDLKTTSFGRPAQNFTTFASNYGQQIEHWNGIDVNVNARPRGDVRIQGGLSTGRTVSDDCAVAAKLPETLFGVIDTFSGTTGSKPEAYCHMAQNFQTQLKLLAIYSFPKIDVQLSGTLQSIPGPQIAANYTATNAVIAPSLGRPLAGGSANATINLVEPGTMFGDRLNQLDMRVAKLVRVGRLRTALNVDLYNVLNQGAVITESAAYGTWRVPQIILQARFVKLSVQLDF